MQLDSRIGRISFPKLTWRCTGGANDFICSGVSLVQPESAIMSINRVADAPSIGCSPRNWRGKPSLFLFCHRGFRFIMLVETGWSFTGESASFISRHLDTLSQGK